MEEMDKRVDEVWKNQVATEKAAAHRVTGEPEPSIKPEASATPFIEFLSTLSMQVMGALETNLDQARYLIDLLGTLKEKTQGNLTPQESQLLESLLYELRMKYVAKRNPAPPPGGKR